MTDEESPTESQPTDPTESQDIEQAVEQTTGSESRPAPPTEDLPTQTVEQSTGAWSAEEAQQTEAVPTELLGRVQTGPGSRERTTKRVILVAAAVVLVAALAFGLTQFLRKDALPPVEETAAAEVFLEPADSVGDSPFAPTGFTTEQPDPTHPGSDPVGPPPPAPAAPPDGQAPMTLRTANGDLPGLYGGTLDTTTCDAVLMKDYLRQNPNKAKAWAGVHRIAPAQIDPYIDELTPVLLRTDTRVTDHGYIEVGQAIARQAVLQAGTAVLVDKYGAPRARCISGSPLLDPIAATAPAVRRAGNVAVQPAAAPARPRVVFVGPRWPRFDPVMVVVIRRVARIIEYFLIWDFRRGALIARRVGILLRDIANLLDPRLARIVPVALLPRPAAGRPPLVPPPLQPPRPAPQRPPVQAAPGRPPVPPPAAPPIQQPPAAPPVQQPPALAPAPAPPPIVDTWDPPIFAPPPPIIDTWDPPVMSPGIPGGHDERMVPQPQSPSGSMPEHQPQIAGGMPADGGHPQAPIQDDPGVYVPSIDGSNSNPDYPSLPQAPSSGGHQQSEMPAHETAPIPGDTGSGGYTEPDYGSLPGATDTGGDPGGNLQCDPILNPC